MNLALHIARRYLFAKKSHNAINIISMISVCGITVATMALVCALSVFNGFTDVVANTFSAFDPELQITPAKGKVFDPTSKKIEEIKALPEIEFTSESLEDNALIKFADRQEPIILKGVSANFINLANVNNLIIDGKFSLREGDIENGVIGAGMAMFLGVRAGFLDPVELYAPKRNERINLANPATAFTQSEVFVSGVFALNQQKYDDQMFIVSIDLARELFHYDKEISSLDIKVKDGYNVDKVHNKIKSIIGKDELLVKNRFEQQADLYRMVNVEKWVTFLILCIILIIAVFNVIGSLTMLIIEKDEDVRILKSLGANNTLITRIFLFEGWLITFVGAVVGVTLGLTLCLLQQYFGLLKLGNTPGAFVIDAYPVSVQALDIVLIFVTVSIIGFLAVIYPVNNLRKRL
ncbi:ABC transporter permease [Dysgonomonas mossii]|uniref:ABC transporter permease n=1 Tax=Dysgonomonas mossii TaxID=163665 RepID=A0A4Y9IJA7_9BACT|nr:FtsX-like permease family protein [Dysgonomonas mossii]MBF0762480.1 ABC transporter permease [Dysgonomonas mossii]TFU87146.1 ABC transporter permease [Dysgonomonas mossii]